MAQGVESSQNGFQYTPVIIDEKSMILEAFRMTRLKQKMMTIDYVKKMHRLDEVPFPEELEPYIESRDDIPRPLLMKMLKDGLCSA